MVRRCFPSFWKLLRQIDDPRVEDQCTYTLTQVLDLAIFMFACRIPSRQALDRVSKDALFLDNWCKFARAYTDAVVCSAQMINVLKKLDTSQLADVAPELIRGLIRQKQLPEGFILGHLALAGDGTGIFATSKRHCEQCLRQEHKDGSVTYMHQMLEVKVICKNGMALSVISEPILNSDEGRYDKQDCESKAFKRVVPRIKEKFPRQPIVYLLDALYCNGPTFHLLDNMRHKFICVFKKGCIPTLYEDVFELLKLESQNTLIVNTGTKKKPVRSVYRWLDNVEYDGMTLGFVMCEETKDGETNTFAWLTNFTPTRDNVQEIAQGGRLRWKIENEGFNEQKTGYELEHFCDCSDLNAMICLYLLLQIAHMFMQLLARSNLVEDFGTLTFLAQLLLEALRNLPLADYLFEPNLPRIQIRFARAPT